MKTIYTLSKIKMAVLLAVLLVTATNVKSQSCSPQGNPAVYGSNNIWRAYVYQGINFNSYRGYVEEGNTSNPDFNQSFGGNQVSFATNGCPAYTDTFSVRYRLTKTFASGNYEITVGGDDGYRFSIDGGNTWVINRWQDQGYQTTTVNLALNGTYNLVLEYYERFGANRVSFSLVAVCMGNGDPATYGTGDTWIGYLYQGRNFNAYKGFITRGTANAIFDENFGTPNGHFATSNCSITTQNFSARFRLRRNFVPGTYVFTVGGDDGYRLSLDGGNTWVINRWFDQSYSITSVTLNLSGSRDMVLEFYENGGDNRLSFNMSSSALPIVLKNWSAQLVSTGKARLSWTAESAINFDHFLVQRSTDGNTFNNIQKIASNNHSSDISVNYSAQDNNVPAGTVYYRLAMVDLDGSIRYSTIQVISNTTTKGIKVFPTVVENGRIMISSDKSLTGARIEIINMNGQVLQTSKWSSSGLSIPVQLSVNTVAGTYLVRVTSENNTNTIQKIIVK